jgi:predicted phosphodiesterase
VRIGLIADIHGNSVALETVLTELTRERVDRVVCLGDVAVLGPEPAAVMALLRELAFPVVMGNTDAWPWRSTRPVSCCAATARRARSTT